MDSINFTSHSKEELIIWNYDQDHVKVGAARLIELIKNKISTHKNVSLFENHSLVLITNGQATQEDVLNYASEIQDLVYKTFNIKLEIEPNIIFNMFIWSSIAHLIALTSPGPDTAVTIRQVSLYGRNAEFYSHRYRVGIYVHCFLAINGISLFILENELYKLSISIIGSSYIFYLGISMLRSDSVTEYNQSNSQNSSSIYGSFFSGLITNIFNVKAFIFFVSLFTILIDSIQGIFFYLYPIYFSITSHYGLCCYLFYLLHQKQ